MRGWLLILFRAAVRRSGIASHSPRAKARTPANISGRKDGELSAVSAVLSAVAIDRRPAPLLKFRSSAVPQFRSCHLQGWGYSKNAGALLKLDNTATTTRASRASGRAKGLSKQGLAASERPPGGGSKVCGSEIGNRSVSRFSAHAGFGGWGVAATQRWGGISTIRLIRRAMWGMWTPAARRGHRRWWPGEALFERLKRRNAARTFART